MKVLVTGGLGYIGSHIAVLLAQENIEFVLLDNEHNADVNVLRQIRQITKKSELRYVNIDLLDKVVLSHLFMSENFTHVIHLAGFKSVSESVTEPLMYYRNNLFSTIILLEVMKKYKVSNLIFSSSATVYDTSGGVPFTESSRLGACSPYGQTKLIIEQIIRDLSLNVVILRYFNPIGNHSSGLIGDSPTKSITNLMPHILQVALKLKPCLHVYGNDYDTLDGTCERDFIHVMDVAEAHMCALQKLNQTKINNVFIYNLGTGKPTSVLKLIATFEKESGIKIPVKMDNRRLGDVAVMFANNELAKKELLWVPKYDINHMCRDAWMRVKK